MIIFKIYNYKNIFRVSYLQKYNTELYLQPYIYRIVFQEVHLPKNI
jgi:hypothetical protein